jgi:DNA polymerase
MTSDAAHLDFETFSQLDIRKVGGHRYARHPSTEVLIARYMLPGMVTTREWLPRSQRPPKDLVSWVASGGVFVAHNASFERLVWQYALRRQHPSIPAVADKQWSCTAARAAASGLPRSLDHALKAIDAPVKKNEEGKRLIAMFCKPRKPTKKDARTRILPEDAPEDFERFSLYCHDDVMGEAYLDSVLPELTSRERMMFRLDMRMNDRGLPIDIPLVRKALAVVQELERRVAVEVQAMTGGVKATQVAKMLQIFAERGLDIENMQKGTIEEALKGEHLDADTRRLLELRIEAGKASTKKLVSMMLCADPDDHVVQGGFLFHGAHTGRYAGRLVQPHNFIRGHLKGRQREAVFALLDLVGDEFGVVDVADMFQMWYEKPIDTISQCMRGFIRAPNGYELAVVDYTAIEARVLAWVAGEEHMLKAYFAGVDVYKLMAKKLWMLDSIDDVTDEQRRIAKNLVLGCGYALGGPRFVEYAANAGCIIEVDFALKAVKTYRKEHPAIVASWKKVEALWVAAVTHPGKVYEGLSCRFYMRDHWLCIQLPSGRELRYPYAAAIPSERFGKPSWALSFKTDYHGKLLREGTYGGKLIENIVQAIARDIMMEGMYSAETNGYEVVGTVHDEALTLRPVGTSNIKALEKIVCAPRAWMAGMPLAAKGFVCDRYKKD